MRYGIYLPNFGDYGDPATLVDLARQTEAAGWDGFFLWDHLQLFDPAFAVPVVDPWVALSAIATVTEHIRLGPLVTPLARRRPWKLARETVSLDRLSGGRLILGVGLGEPAETEFAWFDEDADPAVRAAKLDEGLAVLAGLWSGRPFSFAGEHFQVRETVFLPTPVQTPRIPVWVAGYWPNRAPMRRAARWDGVFPADAASGGMRPLSPDALRQVLAYIRDRRGTVEPFDAVLMGETPGDDRPAARAIVAPYAEAGLTWWLEALHGYRGPLEATRERIAQGPPSIESRGAA
jgi:alkanesulfonate monooxygenase SsuD/methylene tetrahydromethanopterin reductase-like flavin-dependent oxidoreductase (luciferase family)